MTLSKKSIGGNGFEAIWNEVTKPIADDISGSPDSDSSFVTVAGTEGGAVTPASSASTNNGSSKAPTTATGTGPGAAGAGAGGAGTGGAGGAGGGVGAGVGVTNTSTSTTAGGGNKTTARAPSRGRCPGSPSPAVSAWRLEEGWSAAKQQQQQQHYPFSSHHYSLSFEESVQFSQQSSSAPSPSTAAAAAEAGVGAQTGAQAFAALLSSIYPQSRTSSSLYQQQQQGQQPVNSQPMFHCAINNLCISMLLRCDGLQNCAYGDRSDEEGCVKEHSGQLGALDLLGGIAGLTLFTSFTLGILCLTGIMVANWYRRQATGEAEKEAAVAGNGGPGATILGSAAAGVDGFGGGGGGGGGASCSGSLHLSKMSTSACGSSLGGGVGCIGGGGGSQSGTSYLVGHLSSPHHHYSTHQLPRHMAGGGALASIHPSASRTGSPRHLITTGGGGGGGSHHGSPYHLQRGATTTTTTTISSGHQQQQYPCELTGPGSMTPTHRAAIIEVMTLAGGGSLGSSAASAAGGLKGSKWSTLPSTSSEGNQLMLDGSGEEMSLTATGHHHHHHHHQHSYMQQQQQQLHDSLDSPQSNASIPPPPPPPTIGSASGAASYILAGGSRPTASSLASYYAERPPAFSGIGNTLSSEQTTVAVTTAAAAGAGIGVGLSLGSVTSIDRFAGYRTLGRTGGGGGGGMGSTLITTRQQQQQPALPTFGYGPAQSSFHTLPHPPHHVHAHHSQPQQQQQQSTYLNQQQQQQQQQQQKLSPSADSILMMDQMVQTNINAGAGNSNNNNSNNNNSGQLQPSSDHNGGTLDEDDTSISLRMAATSHLQSTAAVYGNGNSGLNQVTSPFENNSNNFMLGDLDDDQSEAMMMAGLGGSGGINHSSDLFSNKNKRTFITSGSYMLSDQSDSLLIDE